MTAICKCKTSKQIKWKVVVFSRRDINYRSFDSNLKISIIKNDARCISAELERDLYESNNARSMLSTSFWISQAQKNLGGYTSHTVPVSSGWVGYGQINLWIYKLHTQANCCHFRFFILPMTNCIDTDFHSWPTTQGQLIWSLLWIGFKQCISGILWWDQP